MSTLYQLHQQYCENPKDEEISDLLCKRIRKYARIVLKRFRLDYTYITYEDFMQLAIACFFHIAPKYKKEKGTLEGYFIYSFRSEVIDNIQDSGAIKYQSKTDMVDCTLNALDSLIFDELSNEIEDILTTEELRILNTYLKEGEHNYERIARIEMSTPEKAKWAIDTIRNKIRQYLNDKYDYQGYGGIDD